VFQNYALFPHMTVFDNVAYGLTVRRVAKAEIRTRVNDMLARVELVEKADAMPHQLSGGQMQRVALARALINEPAVLLLDEPLGALDAKLRKQMQIELKHMQRRFGMTFVYVTHDQEEAMVMSDRVVVMDAGRIQQIGTPAAIYARPANRFVASFLGSANFVPVTVEAMSNGIASVRLHDGTRLRCGLSQPLDTGESALLFIRPEHASVTPNGASGISPADNVMQGRLLEVIHLGALRRLTFDIGGGVRLDVDRLSTSTGIDDPIPGSSWRIGLPAERSILFPADATTVPTGPVSGKV
jgi:spermidine/putrescine transport system ATP-binding protein